MLLIIEFVFNFQLQTATWAEKQKEAERLQEDLEQQLETVQTALKAVKGEKDSLQAQIVTVSNYSMNRSSCQWLHFTDSTAELGAGGQPTGKH